MSTWKLAPGTGQVSGESSNMPLLLSPSVTELGAWTLAQAQSARFYTDSGLVTEVAREVVSNDELHFKGASVSSASEFWVDEDGIRADYAVTDTYGRNAVWSDYLIVYHMNSVAGSLAVNSTGGTDGNGSLNDGGATFPLLTSSGRVENGFNLGTHTQKRGVNTQVNNPYFIAGSNDTPRFTESIWANTTTTNQWGSLTERNRLGGFAEGMRFTNAAKMQWRFRGGSVVTSTNNYANTGWVYAALVKNANTSANGYVKNATHNQWVAVNGTGTLVADSATMILGLVDRATAANVGHGLIDEYRMRNTDVAQNWLDTEYNNQSNNAAFWVAEAAGGGGGGPIPTEYTLECGSGSFSLTGNAANLSITRQLSLDTGAFAFAGSDSGLSATRQLALDTGAFAITGNECILSVSRSLAMDTGAFVLTGTDANLNTSRRLALDPGTYSLTGTDTGVSAIRSLSLDSGSFALTGTDVDQPITRRLALQTGAFELVGSDVSMFRGTSLTLEPGTFTVNGQNTSIQAIYTLPAETSGFTLSGLPLGLVASLSLPLEAGAYVLTGNDLDTQTFTIGNPFCPGVSPFADANSPFAPFPESDCS